MTIKEFLDDISQCESHFRLSPEGYIESNDELCPIRQLAVEFDLDEADEAFALDVGVALGLRRRDTNAIIDAADGRECRLRRRLLEACGLTTKGGGQ